MTIWDYIRWPFGALIRVFYNWTGSYAVALLFFTIVLNLVLFPLSIKQQKTQIGSAKLRPQIYAIEKKYAGRNDRKTQEKKQQEIMALQQEAGFSPLSGCLPMLIQLPLIMILYRIVYMPLTYITNFTSDVITGLKNGINTVIAGLGEGSSLALGALTDKSTEVDILSHFRQLTAAGHTIPDIASETVAAMQELNFSLFGLDLTATPSIVHISWLIIIPILTFVASFLSMKLSRKMMGNVPQPAQTQDNKTSNIIMDIMMPAMSLFISFSLPAALGVYWIYNSVIGIGRQYVLNLIMPLPKYTDEELKLLEKEARERAKRNPAQFEDRVSEKSLHHIDDEDDDYDVDSLPVIQSKFDGEYYRPTPAKKPASKSSGKGKKKK
ncbi:MAG: YidC/Oxa1 family membrane protein insertase [Clostridia bacterium]|nr:YidC/Oxa1 family membrane protein insertase [Clostridia bacterium]